MSGGEILWGEPEPDALGHCCSDARNYVQESMHDFCDYFGVKINKVLALCGSSLTPRLSAAWPTNHGRSHTHLDVYGDSGGRAGIYVLRRAVQVAFQGVIHGVEPTCVVLGGHGAGDVRAVDGVAVAEDVRVLVVHPVLEQLGNGVQIKRRVIGDQ